MQELLEWAKDKDMSDTMISPQDLLDAINPLLEKEKEQIRILTDALERIRDWDDEMHSEWDDCGEFAIFTLKTYNQNK